MVDDHDGTQEQQHIEIDSLNQVNSGVVLQQEFVTDVYQRWAGNWRRPAVNGKEVIAWKQ